MIAHVSLRFFTSLYVFRESCEMKFAGFYRTSKIVRILNCFDNILIRNFNANCGQQVQKFISFGSLIKPEEQLNGSLIFARL